MLGLKQTKIQNEAVKKCQLVNRGKLRKVNKEFWGKI